VTLLGPSGCGKSTLLMIVAGLYPKTAGEVLLDGCPIDRPGLDRGVVFQEFALFPWLSVKNNIRFGLQMKGVPREEHDRIIRGFVELVGLEGFEDIYPHRLSGGMKQRVGIARALAYDPELLLLDEPFGALDAQTRASLQRMLVGIWEKTRKTVLFVTHSIREAVFLSDKVCVLTARPGRVLDVVPIELPRPRNMLSAEFFDYERRLAGLISGQLGIEAQDLFITD
ncbi:MAG: ABC transporter ATP-binding protein, partial [Deltaproteobacteria bacterium]|nr:ABC transporter ATP-binding protein [Deltaproteobacteria bacterium]